MKPTDGPESPKPSVTSIALSVTFSTVPSASAKTASPDASVVAKVADGTALPPGRIWTFLPWSALPYWSSSVAVTVAVLVPSASTPPAGDAVSVEVAALGPAGETVTVGVSAPIGPSAACTVFVPAVFGVTENERVPASAGVKV